MRVLGFLGLLVTLGTYQANSAWAANGTWTVNANGNWSTTSNWTSLTVPSGTDAIANFTGVNITASRTVTLDIDATIGTLQLGDVTGNQGWTIGGTKTLTFSVSSAPGIIQIGGQTAGQTNTISVTISGTQGIQITNTTTNQAATLLLSGANTYTGGTTLTGTGLTLSIGADDNLGNTAAANGLTLNSGTLSTTAGFSSARNVTLGGGTLSVTGTLTLSGDITGAGGLKKLGAGTLVISGTNTNYTGGVTVTAGTLMVGADAHFGNASNGITLSGGTLTITNSISVARTVTLSATTTSTIDVGANTVTWNNSINGGGSANARLVKEGAGTLILTASSDRTSGTATTSINAGVVQINHGSALGGTATAGMDVVIANGARLDVNSGITLSNGLNLLAADGSEFRALGNATLNSRITPGNGATVTISTSASGDIFTLGNGANDITGGNASSVLKVTGPGTVLLNNASNATYNGGWLITGGTLMAGQSSALGDATLGYVTISTGGTLSTNAAFTLTQILNFNGGTLASSNNMTFSGAANLSASSSTINTGTLTFIFSGVMAGTGGVTKTGSGTMQLTNPNTNAIVNSFSGTTTISAGTFQAGAVGAFSANSAVALANLAGATLSLNNFDQTIAALSGGGAAGGNVALGTASLTFGNATNTTYAGVISGSGSLIKAGSGTTTLTGSNTMTGAVTVYQGVLNLAETNGKLAAATGFNLNGGILQLDNTTTYNGDRIGSVAISMTGGTLRYLGRANAGANTETVGAVTLATGTANIHVTQTAGANASATLTLGGLTPSGLSATVNFSNTNGTLGSGSASNPSIKITGQNAGYIGGWATVNGSDFALYNTTNGVHALGGVRPALPTFALAGHVQVTLNSPSALTGNTLVDSLLVSASGATTLSFGGNTLRINSGGFIRSGGDLTIQNGNLTAGTGGDIALWAWINSGTTTVSANLVDVGPGSVSLVKSGAGTIILNGTGNTYSGATSVNQGTLQLGAANALSSGGALTLVNAAGATLNLNGNHQTVGSLVGGGSAGGTLSLGSATLTLGGDNTSTTFDGTITGTGGSLVKQGTGTFVLTQANSFTAGVTILNGSLQVDHAAALGTGATITLGNTTGANSATLIVGGNAGGLTLTPSISVRAGSSGAMTIQSTNAFNTNTLSGNVTLSHHLVVSAEAGGVLLFSGVISQSGGSFGLTKNGAGTVQLTNANTFGGAVTVNQGTLALMNASGSITNASSFTLNNGGTLWLDNTAASNSNRLPTVGVTMNGGILLLTNLAGNATTLTETIGTVTLASGSSYLMNDRNTGSPQGSELSLSGLVHAVNSTSTVVFAGKGGLGTNLGGAGSSARILIAGQAAGFMGGWATAERNSNSGRPDDFAAYNATTGVMTLTDSGVVKSALSSGVNGGHYTANSNVTLGANTTVDTIQKNSASTFTTTVNALLRVNSNGGILVNTGTWTITGSGNLTAGPSNTPTTLYFIADTGPTSLYIPIIDNGVSGAVTLVKSGINVLEIDAASTHTGGTYVTEGELDLNVANAITGSLHILGGSTVVTLTSSNNVLRAGNAVFLGDSVGSVGASLLTNKGSVTIDSPITVVGGTTGVLTIGNSGANNGNFFTGNITLSNNVVLSAPTNATNTITFSGTITESGGTYGITKNGIGILALGGTGTNAWSGPTFINSGTLAVVTPTGMPSTTSIVFTSSPTSTTSLDLSALSSQTIAGLSGGAATSVSVSLGSAVLTVSNSSSMTYAGTITGSGGLVKQNSGTLVLTHTGNTFTSLSIAAGVLSVSADGAMGATNSSIVLAGGTLRWTGAGSTTLNANHTISTTSTSSAIDVAGVGATLRIGQNLTSSGGLTKLGEGTLELAGASNTYLGTTTVSAGTLHIIGTLTSGGGVVAVGTGGTLQGSGATSILRDVTVTGNGTLSFSGGSIGGTLTATGGFWTGNGSVGGAITINPGVFTIVSGSTLTASGLTTINSSGILNVAGTLSGSASLVSGGTITGSGGTITGTLAVTGGTWNGSGTVSGAISATAGTFTLSSGATLTSSAGATVNGTNTWNNNGTLAGNMSLASGGTISGSGGTITGTLSITDGAWSGSGTVNGAVSQTAGTFNLTNSGTLTTGSTVSISGGTFNVLSGSTLNNAGNATVTGSATLSANGVISGGVVVNNGGTLHGNGTISGSVTINSGGNLSAGNSVGHLTVDDDLTWNSGSNQTFEISDADMLGTPGTDWDLITVNGELTLNATPSSKINLTFDSWPPGTPLDNFSMLDDYSWLWVTTTGGIDVGVYPVNDLFAITLGSEFLSDFPSVDVDKFSVSMSLDGLNMFVNYTYTVVPEPGSLLLLSLASTGLGVYGRRLRRRSREPASRTG